MGIRKWSKNLIPQLLLYTFSLTSHNEQTENQKSNVSDYK